MVRFILSSLERERTLDPVRREKQKMMSMKNQLFLVLLFNRIHTHYDNFKSHNFQFLKHTHYFLYDTYYHQYHVILERRKKGGDVTVAGMQLDHMIISKLEMQSRKFL